METMLAAAAVTSPVPRDTWEAVLAADPAALPEAAWGWVQALAGTGGYRDASRCYRFADGTELVLPLVRRRGLRGLGGALASYPAGWGIGGLIGPEPSAQQLAAVLADLRSVRAQRVLIRPDPLRYAPWAQALHAESGAARPAVSIARRAHVVDLSAGMDQLWTQLSQSARRKVRIARRSAVAVRVGYGGELLDEYYLLYLASLRRWARTQHEPAALALARGRLRDPLAKLHGIAGQLDHNFVVSLACIDGRPVCGSILLLGNTAHQTRSAMDQQAVGTSGAGELLQWSTLGLACDRGLKTFHMGESGQSARLAQFKEKFGAQPHDYAELRLERLPYTGADAAVRTLAKRILGFRDV